MRAPSRYLALALLAVLGIPSPATGPAPAYAQAPGGRPIPVLVTRVSPQSLVDRIEALGTLKSNESVDLTASVTKTVSAIHFEDGQRVEKGFVLAEMTSTEESALLAEARAEAKEARIQLDRLAPLIERGAVPTTTVDERRRNLATAEARVQAIQSRLQDLLIVAPFDGIVGLRAISEGALVAPGTRVATIDDDSVMKLDFSVPSAFLPVLQPGLKVVTKARAFENRRFEGAVTSVDTRVDPITRSVAVRALIPNPDRSLKPGLLMTIELFRNPRESLVIPEDAVVSLGREHSVFVALGSEADGFKAERRVIGLGTREPGLVEVTQGLSSGELVVVHGTMLIRPGAALQVLKELAPGDSIRDAIRGLSAENNA